MPQALILAAEDQLVGSLCKRHAVAQQRAPTACRRTVSGSISLPCSGCFSPFPHGTGPLSVFREYLALRVGPRGFAVSDRIPRVPPYSGGRYLISRRPYGGVTRCARPFQTVPVPPDETIAAPTTPHLPRQVRFGLLPVRSPLLRQSIVFFLLLRVLRCFSSPRSPRLLAGDWTPSSRVAPFGHARIDTCLRFPVPFRSLPRPSSPPEA